MHSNTHLTLGCTRAAPPDEGLRGTREIQRQDDGLIAGSTQSAVDSFLKLLTSEFRITTGSLDSFLGMHIQKHKSGFAITQRTYAKKILERFEISKCNVSKTFVINQQLSTGENDTLDGKIPYRSAVGSLMYLCCATRPDIAYAVSRAARALSSPTHQDWIAVKQIFRYTKSTIYFGLYYTSSITGLCVYTDADYAGDLKTRRSTNGFVAMIRHAAVSWTSQLQKSVALSTTKTEFVAASEEAKELVWLNRLMSEINSQEKHTPTLFVDNASTIKLVKNHEFHKRTKHITIYESIGPLLLYTRTLSQGCLATTTRMQSIETSITLLDGRTKAQEYRANQNTADIAQIRGEVAEVQGSLQSILTSGQLGPSVPPLDSQRMLTCHRRRCSLRSLYGHGTEALP
ncbi:unnamed protein product [Trichogramma brassicae]|uniref:Reverse transcriptase Ty1/copia-type domain-containing protein n=1 Tax=Trichogramma brassicae TaxID=86971 RepID=A0A6H5IP19_9HYME|nr:unnamed protein product [Trichogramma brassicae]